MASIKFSAFTNEAVDAATTQLVGYKVGDTSANYRYSVTQLATALSSLIPTIYSADGDIIVNRTINDRAGGFATNAGNGVLKMNIRNSGSLIVAGYQNNGDPGTDNNCIQWGPGTTLGGMNARGALELNNSGGGGIWLKNSGGTQYVGIGSSGSYIDSTLSIGAAAIATETLEVNGNCKITGQAYTELHANATNLVVSWDDSNIQTVTISGSVPVFAPTNPKAGATYILAITQGATPVTVDWNSLVKWPGGTAPTLSAVTGKIDVITLICYNDSGSGLYYGSATLDLA